jgi:vacuolar-type H+-ATPase subunit I/STV1
MMVLMFQLAVVLTIGAAWLFFGKRASLYAAIAWSVWTVAAVQMGWLVILQGVIAWVTFLLLPADDTGERRQLVRRIKILFVVGLLGCLGVGAWLVANHERLPPLAERERRVEPSDRERSPPLTAQEHREETSYAGPRSSYDENCRWALEWDERRRRGVSIEELGPRPPCNNGQWNDDD